MKCNRKHQERKKKVKYDFVPHNALIFIIACFQRSQNEDLNSCWIRLRKGRKEVMETDGGWE